MASCGPPEDLRGNNPDKKTLAAIKPGVTDKASVTKLLGSPSSVASFDPNTWYYISQETQNVAFFKPRINDQKVVSISFNKKGVVDKIAYLGLKDSVKVRAEPRQDAGAGPGVHAAGTIDRQFRPVQRPRQQQRRPQPDLWLRLLTLTAT